MSMVEVRTLETSTCVASSTIEASDASMLWSIGMGEEQEQLLSGIGEIEKIEEVICF